MSGRRLGSSQVMKKGLGARPGSSNLLMVATRQVSLLPSGRSRTMCPSMWSNLRPCICVNESWSLGLDYSNSCSRTICLSMWPDLPAMKAPDFLTASRTSNRCRASKSRVHPSTCRAVCFIWQSQIFNVSVAVTPSQLRHQHVCGTSARTLHFFQHAPLGYVGGVVLRLHAERHQLPGLVDDGRRRDVPARRYISIQ